MASVFRRYLTQMPVSRRLYSFTFAQFTSVVFIQEPVIPHNLYHRVSGQRTCRHLVMTLCNDSSGMHTVSNVLRIYMATFLISNSAPKPFVVEKVVAEFKTLIHSMPRGNQYLLLYVLDLLSVFARKSDKNLMTAQSWCLSPPFEPQFADQACSQIWQ